MKKVVITTGGTGGHIYPALAVAEELKNRGSEVVFIGSQQRMEATLVPQKNIKFIGVNIPVPRRFRDTLRYIKSIFTTFNIIRKEKPDIIVGFGNYISIPAILSGILLGKKLFLQEQNFNLGFANKLFYKFSKKTFLAFENTYDEISIKTQHKFKVTGNPLRKEIYNIKYREEREKLNIKENEKLLLITGGSLGAKEINDEIIKQYDEILSNENLIIFWATGKNNYDNVINNLSKIKKTYRIEPYFDNMVNIMGAADLVICRAGALTISELIELERPSILIPYNSKKVGQYANAKMLEEVKAAKLFQNKNVNEAIKNALDLINNEDELRKMRIKIRSLKKDNAAKTIVDNILED